jgi:predicted HTH domain antitoxin
MSVVISDDYLQAARMSPDELLQEVAVMLFGQHRLTLGQASRLAGLSQYRFQHLLASREIPVHYDIEEFEADLTALGSPSAI